ncbi:hypothetical protein AVEN_151670-1 [Araneus ventricosus]|uniref:DUF4817 domain-containing protein n=1 Tax=Araneus ventricosus TaxID=182803 RepID=A0A4Y2HLH8_ARAVE|nr:hypothetical protein AVEN_151670-1 [Araneus ventricosus]
MALGVPQGLWQENRKNAVVLSTIQQKSMSVLWLTKFKSMIKVKRHYCLEYGCQPPSTNSIKRWIEQFKETGSVQHRLGADRLSVRDSTIDVVHKCFRRSPTITVCQASRELQFPKLTIHDFLI